MIPGEYILAEGEILANANRATVEVRVVNTGDRAIQVGSHFHFFEVNRALVFDREAAFGMRLNIPSGAAVRFEPGDDRLVRLVRFGGAAIARGFNALCNGPASSVRKAEALSRGARWGFAGESSDA